MELRSGIALGRLGVGEYIRGGPDLDGSGSDSGRDDHMGTEFDDDDDGTDVFSIHCDAPGELGCECEPVDAYGSVVSE